MFKISFLWLLNGECSKPSHTPRFENQHPAISLKLWNGASYKYITIYVLLYYMFYWRFQSPKCDAALLVQYFLMFLRIIMPSKCWNHGPENIASNPRQLISSATPMWEHLSSHRHCIVILVGLWYNGWWEGCPIVRRTEATHCDSQGPSSTSTYSASGWGNISIGPAQWG
jgi:hypothetical protein